MLNQICKAQNGSQLVILFPFEVTTNSYYMASLLKLTFCLGCMTLISDIVLAKHTLSLHFYN